MSNTEHSKKILELRLHALTAELETLATFNEATRDWELIPEQERSFETDDNAEADGFEETEQRQAVLHELEQEYQNILRALAAVAKGTYGQCEICQQDILPERLAVIPTARTCAAHRDEERTLPL